MRYIKTIVLFLLSWVNLYAQQTKEEWNNLVEMECNGKRLTIRLYDNKTARDFAEKLPMSIYMNDRERSTLEAELKDSLVVSDTLIPTIAATKELVYYPQLNQLRYNYDTHVIRLTIQPLGKAVGNKNIFSDIVDGVDVTFRRKE